MFSSKHAVTSAAGTDTVSLVISKLRDRILNDEILNLLISNCIFPSVDHPLFTQMIY